MADESEVDTKSSPNTLSPPKTPTTPSNGGSGDLLTIDSGWGVGRLSRRSSLRASITSIDSAAPALKKEHFQLQEIPPCFEDLINYVNNLVDVFKRTSHLRDVLQGTWVAIDPNATCDGGTSLLHAAAKLGETKLMSAICHFPGVDLDLQDSKGNTALHYCAECGNTSGAEALLKHGSQALPIANQFDLNPVQIAALKCNLECLEVMINHGGYPLVITSKNETLLHLACKGTLSRILCMKDKMKLQLESIPEDSDLKEIETFTKEEEKRILKEAHPCLDFLLDMLKKNPDLLEVEDTLETSPGTVLHYFTCLNHVQGVRKIMQEPYLVNPNVQNKNALSALWIAAWYNMTRLGLVLLEFGADPNVQDLQVGYTPLHCAILGYHVNRVDETCEFIEALLAHGANPLMVDKSGETAPHLSIGTLDFKVMSKFIEYLGPDVHNISDETGNTMFHYAVGYLDEESIYYLMKKAGPACLMMTNCTEVIVDQSDHGFATEQLVTGFQRLHSIKMKEDAVDKCTNLKLNRCRSMTIKRIPLQEAMKNGNVTAYFNAIRRLDIKKVLQTLESQQSFKFLCMHLTAATREVRPDLVRILFNHVTNPQELHSILLFKDETNDDETYTKTALEWAVENNDRLCTTEILHQEYECHQNDRKAGLNCLRMQLTGDELLEWTIETFTMFYSKTWAQSVVFPLLGLIPLIFSISTFVFDYYSDFELSYEYYINAFTNALPFANETLKNTSEPTQNPCQSNGTHVLVPTESFKKCWMQWQLEKMKEHSLQNVDREHCVDITRNAEEYRTAFFFNIICISLPILVFYVMCFKEMWTYLHYFEYENKSSGKYSPTFVWTLKILFWPCTVLFAPFYILYIAVRQVIFKFQHRRATRKNKYRAQLQKSEFLWGISRTAEAALESCGQLVLQIWLLSSDFNALSNDSFLTLADKTYNGVIFFLTFSYKDATYIEKSLGKIFMSLLALVGGVAASYRTLKRGSVKWNNTLFIYFSLTFQIFARMFALGIFFFTARNFMPTVPILLCLHFIAVFILKWTFERVRHTQGMMALFVAILNIFASSLVYIRVLPIDKQINARHKGINYKRMTQQHSTFFVQSLFFLLVFVENMLMASWPLIKGEPNRALACLGQAKMLDNVGIVAGLCVGSWVFHIMYYKYMGHPWTEINGPQIHNHEVGCFMHLCGNEKYLTCGLSQKNCCETKSKDAPGCEAELLSVEI